MPPEAAEEGESGLCKKMGPRRSPAQRVRWGEEEQGSGGRATSGSPKQSGLCDDEKVPPEAAEEGDRAEAEKAPGEKKVGQICDDVGQKRDEFYLLLCYTGYSKSQGLGGPGWGDAGKLRLLSA